MSTATIIAVILCIIFFAIGLVVGISMKKTAYRDGIMLVDEKMGIASISWEVPYEEIVSAKSITLEVVHKDA